MTAHDTYAPGFAIRLNGAPPPTPLRAAITSVRLQDGIEGADRVELAISNERLALHEHPLLRPGIQLELDMGYAPGPLRTLFLGEITGVETAFPAGGTPTVTVAAHDFLHRMAKGTKERSFAVSLPGIGHFPLPDPVVADIVAASNLLVPVIDPVGAALTFLTLLIAYSTDAVDARNAVQIQKGESDFAFLKRIAAENGWELFIDHDVQPHGRVLRFGFLIADFAPVAVLRWGASLIDFTPRVTTIGQVYGVSTRVWVTPLKQELQIVLAWDFDRSAFDLQVYPGSGKLELLIGRQKAQNLLQIKTLANSKAPKRIMAELIPRLNSRQTATGTTIGDPVIRAGKVVDFQGLGERFGGLYRITSSTHTIDSGGYRTAFEARKEVWFDAIPTAIGAEALRRIQTTIGAR